tara:strand:+ start:62 stop:814 length:753 start_codon:yes stop_codon:yes gene_type:complete
MTIPTLIQDSNISKSWLEVLGRFKNPNCQELSPLIVTITDFTEDSHIRDVLDAHLITNNKQSIQTVSETIFPISLQRLFKNDRHSFYEEYMGNFKRIQKLDAKRNGRGTYFQRLIDYRGKDENVNQLENIITAINDKKNNRRSRYQASTFDPFKDNLDGPYLGFPCLQHVTFYVTKEKGLVLNGFYAMQHVYEKAYGNWLGLINLGKFVSEELGISFERFNCFISIEKLDSLSKKETKKLFDLATKATSI